MKRFVLLVAATTAMTVASCGTGQVAPSTPVPTTLPTALPSETPATASAGTATLSTDSCAFEPSATMPAGGFTISVVNTTRDDAGFDLYRLRADVTYAEWVAGGELYDAAFGANIEPEFGVAADPIDLQEAVSANAEGRLVAGRAEPGVYALQCWRFPTEGPTRLMSAGPIVVGPAPAATPTPVLTVTLTDRGCTMTPAQPSIPEGQVEISIINASPDRGWFGLQRIAEGHTYEELDAHVSSDRERVEAGDEPIGPPTWVTIPEIREPAAWSATPLRTTLAVGIHAIACGRIDPTGERVTGGPFLVGPLGGE